MVIEVLGYSCSRTSKLLQSAESYAETASSQGAEVLVEKVEDGDRFKALGVRSTPACALDGVLLFQGCGMSADGLKKMIEKHLSEAEPSS